jgi:TP901 family phage tail tape measure protein
MSNFDISVGAGKTIQEDMSATMGSDDPQERQTGITALKELAAENENIKRVEGERLKLARERLPLAEEEKAKVAAKLKDDRKALRETEKVGRALEQRVKNGDKIYSKNQKILDDYKELRYEVGQNVKIQKKLKDEIEVLPDIIKEAEAAITEADTSQKYLNEDIEKAIRLDRQLTAGTKKRNQDQTESNRQHQERMEKIRRKRAQEIEQMRQRNQLDREFIQGLDAIQQSFQTTVTQSIAVAGAAFMGLKAKMDQVVSVFQKFEAQLINAQSIFQTSNDTLFGLSDQIVAFGSQYGISLDNAAEGLYQFASAGLSASESQMVLQDTLKLSMAVQGDHNTISKLTTQTIFGFGLEMSQAGELTDKFAHAINKSLIEYQDLASAVKFAMPFFVSTGQSVDQLLGSLQVLTNRALEAGIAGRGLRQALAEFAQHAEDNTAAFAKMGVEITNTDGSFKQLTEIAYQFQEAMGPAASDVELMTTLLEDLNVRGATAFVHLVQNADEFQGAVNDLQNSAGSATEMAEIQQASLENQIQRVKNALAAPFLLSDELGKSKGFLNEFSMVLHQVVSMFENLFVVIEDGIITGLTPMGEMMKQMAIESLHAFATIGYDIIQMLMKFSEEGQGIAGLLQLITAPLRLIVGLFGALGTDVLQTVLTLKVLNGILPITNMLNVQNIQSLRVKQALLVEEVMAQKAATTGAITYAQAQGMVRSQLLGTIAAQMTMQISMFAMVYLTQRIAKGNVAVAATFGALAGAIMAVAIAFQLAKSAASLNFLQWVGIVVAGMAVGALFNTMMMGMMTPPDIDYSKYEQTPLADTGRRIYDTGGLGNRHQNVMVEPGETIISKTANMASGRNQGITINIGGDVYDGDNFAEKVGLALPNALRNVDDAGGL